MIFCAVQGAAQDRAAQKRVGAGIQHRGRRGRGGDIHFFHPGGGTGRPERRTAAGRPASISLFFSSFVVLFRLKMLMFFNGAYLIHNFLMFLL